MLHSAVLKSNWVQHGSSTTFETGLSGPLLHLLGPHTVLSTLPDNVGEPGFGPYLPVSRLEYEIFWIITERLPFLVDSTFQQWNFKYFALFELLFLILTLNVSSQTPVCYFNVMFFSSVLRHRKYSRQSESKSVFAQMTSCAVRYHVIYHPFHVNSQYL